MKRVELIQQVTLRMDEITPSAGLSVTVDGSDNNPLYELIDGLVDDGVLELFSIAPYWRLPQTAFPSSNISLKTVGTERVIYDRPDHQQVIGQRKVIRLKLADDFMRVAEINCSEFQRPITEVFPEQSPEGRNQHNSFLMGKEARPIGIMSTGKWGSGQDEVISREINCYSLPSDTAVTESDVSACYIAKPTIPPITDTTNNLPVPDVLLAPLEWIIASRAFDARGDSAHAEICQRNIQNLLV